MKQPLIFKKSAGALLLFVTFVLPSTSNALCPVTLQWDSNAPIPEGYRLFVHEKDQNYNYSSPNWEGAETTATINGLEEGKTYYSVVRAFKEELESSDSNEIYYTFDKDCKIISSNFPWNLVIPAIGEKVKK
jgi:chitinase